MNGGTLVSWRGVGCAFGGRDVFSGFTGEWRAGERLRLVAPSGGGKTTFLEMLLGATPVHIGAIKRCAGFPDRIAYVPQEPDFGVEGTVREALLEPFTWKRNRADRPDDGAIRALLARLRLHDGILDERIASVSGGERRRLALAVALLLPREALVLDEPFAALDADAARAAADVILASGRAVLYATHGEGAAGFATREVTL